MNKIRHFLKKTIGNPLVFSCLLVLTMMVMIVPALHEDYGYLVKYLLAWGLVLSLYLIFASKGKVVFNRYMLPLLAFCAFYLVTIYLKSGENRTSAMKSLLYMGMTFLVVMGGSLVYPGTRKKLEEVFAIVITGGINCLSLICLATYFFKINGSYRAEGTKVYYGFYQNRLWGLFNPNVGAALAMVALVLSIGLLTMMKKRILRIWLFLSIFLEYLMLILTDSRTAIYGGLLLAFFFLWRVFFVSRTEKQEKEAKSFRICKAGAFSLGLLVLVFLSMKGITPVLEKLPTLVAGAEDKTETNLGRKETGADSYGGFLNGRQYIWSAGWKVFQTSPVIGVGREGIYRQGKDYVVQRTFRRAFRRGGLHNIYLTVLVAGGLLGFLAFAGFVLLALTGSLRNFLKIKQLAGQGLYLSYLFLFFYYLASEMLEARILYEMNVNYVIFWIIAGVVLGRGFFKEKKVQTETFDQGQKKFLANTGWLMVDKIVTMVLSLVINAMVSRYLGKANWGILNYGLAFFNVFLTVCKLGIDSILVAEITKKPEKTDSYMTMTILLRLASSFLGILLTGLFVGLLRPGKLVVLGVSLIQSISLIFAAFDTIDYYFQYKMESKFSAISKSCAYLFVCLLRLVLLFAKADVIWFAFATVVDYLAIASFLLYFYKRQGGGFAYSKEDGKYLLHRAKPFIWANLMVVLYTQMDRIMVGSLAGDAQTGLYSAAMTVANMWIFIPTALIDSSRPVIMDLYTKKDPAYMRRFKEVMGVVMYISILAGLALTLLPKLVVWILYGKKYLAAAPILAILIWSKLPSEIGVVRNIWLICEAKEEYVKWFVGGGALTNLILNFIFISWLGGGLGAALATLITEFVVANLIPVFFKDTRCFNRIVLESFKAPLPLIKKFLRK